MTQVAIELLYLLNGRWERDRRTLERVAGENLLVSTPPGVILDSIWVEESWRKPGGDEPARQDTLMTTASCPLQLSEVVRSTKIEFEDPDLLQRTNDYWAKFAVQSDDNDENVDHFCTVTTLAERVLALHGGGTPENIAALSHALVGCVENWLSERGWS